MKRIINHTKVDMTDHEWESYQSICRSYDRPNFKGEEVFVDMFETDGSGIITMVRPPEKRQFTMEAYCFMTSVMMNQHLRIAHQTIEALVAETKQNLEQMNAFYIAKVAELSKPSSDKE